MPYDPTDWYWQIDDGRVWSSARQTWIEAGDASLAAWEAAGGVRTQVATATDVAESLLRVGHLSLAPPSAAGVRVEAARRIRLLLSARDDRHADIIISNGSREAIRLLRVKAERAWTPEEAARAAVLEGVDAAIEAIRVASNAMEGSPPENFAADWRWA